MSRGVTMFGLLLLVFAVWLGGYQSRTDLHRSQVAGCERGKLDREANAQGWRAAQRLANPNADRSERSREARAVAQVYDRIALDLERRARVDCARVFPAPTLLPRPP